MLCKSSTAKIEQYRYVDSTLGSLSARLMLIILHRILFYTTHLSSTQYHTGHYLSQSNNTRRRINVIHMLIHVITVIMHVMYRITRTSSVYELYTKI